MKNKKKEVLTVSISTPLKKLCSIYHLVEKNEMMKTIFSKW